MSLATDTLKKFGLKDNEIKVYLEILKKDELSPFQIAKLTKIPRTTVYDILLGLSLKGLVELEQSDGFTKQQTLVHAKNPSVLRSIINKKRLDLASLELDVLEILPDLKEGFHKKKANADFQFYAGIEGARKVYFSKFSEPDLPVFEWDVLMPMDAFGREAINKDVVRQLDELKRKKVVDKTLIPLTDWTRRVLTYQVGRDKRYLSRFDIRFIGDSSFDIFVQFQIMGDYIRVVCSREEEIWGLRMKSEMLAGTFKAIFEQNWKIATPVTLEMVESWGVSPLLKEENSRDI